MVLIVLPEDHRRPFPDGTGVFCSPETPPKETAKGSLRPRKDPAMYTAPAASPVPRHPRLGPVGHYPVGGAHCFPFRRNPGRRNLSVGPEAALDAIRFDLVNLVKF